MQWKDMDCPTFTEICNSAFKWLDCCNSFSGIQVDYLWQTTCILERQLLVSIVQNQHSSRQAETLTKVVTHECEFFVTMHRCTSHWLQSKLSATVNLDLAPSGYFLLRKLKYSLRWTWFIDDEMKIAVEAWFESQNREFNFWGIKAEKQSWKICWFCRRMLKNDIMCDIIC